ncbi:MAG: hypothetical protein K8I02_07815, partial [Candidatus Methylomirabilis sp.]|nr:hypothetical protein [Deltaproteobacteria bacterium]
PEPPAPKVDRALRWTARRWLCDDLTFASAHEPICEDFGRRHAREYEANHRVHVRWLRRVGGRARPTMLYLHSWMQPNTAWEERRLLPALGDKLGVNVAWMQLPYHGVRRPKGSKFDGEYFWTSDMVRTVEAIRQSVCDLRSAVRWFGEATAEPVGALGVSLGGMIVLAGACFEPRLAFAVPVVAHLDMAAIMEEASLLARMRRDLRAHGWTGAEVEEYVRSLGLAELMPAIPKERILFIGGRYDKFLRPGRIEQLRRRWGGPAIVWFPGGHLGAFRYLSGKAASLRGFLANLEIGADPR